MSNRAGDATVVVVLNPSGIIAGCAQCQTTISEGKFAVGVEVDGHKYLVGHNPPKTCCGNEKKVPLLFDDETAAEQARTETIAILERDGDTSGLKLLERAFFLSVAAH